jgi:hypothetical protein
MTMDVSRRSFLGGILALTAVAVAPKVMAEPLPRIVGDGVHDDTAGLQALFDGNPFTADPRYGVQWVELEDGLRLTGGKFRLTETVRIVGRKHFVIEGCRFDHYGPGAVLNLERCSEGTIRSVHIAKHVSHLPADRDVAALEIDVDRPGPRKRWIPDQYGGGRWFDMPPRLT